MPGKEKRNCEIAIQVTHRSSISSPAIVHRIGGRNKVEELIPDEGVVIAGNEGHRTVVGVLYRIPGVAAVHGTDTGYGREAPSGRGRGWWLNCGSRIR